MERPPGGHRPNPYQTYPQPRSANPQSALPSRGQNPQPALPTRGPNPQTALPPRGPNPQSVVPPRGANPQQNLPNRVQNPQAAVPRPPNPQSAPPRAPIPPPLPIPRPPNPQSAPPRVPNPPNTTARPTNGRPATPHPAHPQPQHPQIVHPHPTYPNPNNPYPHNPYPTPNPHTTHSRPAPSNTLNTHSVPINGHTTRPPPQNHYQDDLDDDGDDLTDVPHQQDVDRRARRLYLQKIAHTTVEAINNGIVDVSKTMRRTRLYTPDSPELIDWQYPPRHSWYAPNRNPANILVLGMSTLQGVQYFYSGPSLLATSSSEPMGTATGTGTTTNVNTNTNGDGEGVARIGVLNFASATQPGGGFLEGARAQEESIARSSTLYVSLTTPAARPFYAAHAKDSGGGFYSHAMIYSPNVHIFRDDNGGWVKPHQVDVLTSPAVNAAHVRRASRFRHIPPAQLEANIEEVMRERMARVLALFERQGARNLVLGSFGTGVFKNDVRKVARVWRELLVSQGARFSRSFENVAFMIPDDETRAVYESVLNPRRRGRNSSF
ncbi:hypothetical protein JR316_0001828 [Psilocybe cubensis]|uniref:Microbial-type PARG catalytic domain-containing protein n=2 Tax=Psilocybe cubensis TaxID=181762 RepID=A0A8H7Y7G3_PSICU|nr:hypothetical protein JR316_0001828 [Psilocybe cubensis]KAH9484926.1 hypothetical protein JR316_0001828 [Psilocybe cubensis]